MDRDQNKEKPNQAKQSSFRAVNTASTSNLKRKFKSRSKKNIGQAFKLDDLNSGNDPDNNLHALDHWLNQDTSNDPFHGFASVGNYAPPDPAHPGVDNDNDSTAVNLLSGTPEDFFYASIGNAMGHQA